MLQFIVSIIAFVVATFVGGYMGEELVTAGLLGVILVNLLLSTSMISDLKKEVAELKSLLEETPSVDIAELFSEVESRYHAVLLRLPSGRILCVYGHNTDNVRRVLAEEGDETITRVDSLGHYVFRYSDDEGKTWSKAIPCADRELTRLARWPLLWASRVCCQRVQSTSWLGEAPTLFTTVQQLPA